MNAETGRRLPPEVILALLAIGIGIVESFLPRPVPFMKFGLANIITIIAVLKYGTITGLKVNILRAVAVSLFLGTMATPAFILSLSGGIISALVMGAVKRFFSVPGVSVSGSIAGLYVQSAFVMLLFPAIPMTGLLITVTVWGVLSGLVTGIIALIILNRGILPLGNRFETY